MNVDDRPGVMAEIAGILGGHGISIASVIQHETDEEEPGDVVPLVIMTHNASEGACARHGGDRRLGSVAPGSVRMRVR